MRKIEPARVGHAIRNLNAWAITARFQSTAHLIPLLSLLSHGAGANDAIHFEESDDFAFWDKYFRLDVTAAKPYFNPITLKLAEKGFPHSNAATIRKNTFRLKWSAAETDIVDGKTFWTLSQDYAQIFRSKVLSKSGSVFRVPLVDLSVILFRDKEFTDDVQAQTLLELFRETFPQDDDSFNLLFEYLAEEVVNLFTEDVSDHKLRTDNTIKAALLQDNIKLVPPPLAATTTGLPVDDPVLIQVQQLMELGTTGIIFEGPPGTGKTWYAKEIAKCIVQDSNTDIFRVQFHPSYGYEDFVEGFAPDDKSKSGFRVEPKKFLQACDRAEQTGGTVVFIVDELNRGDPARVFGELLTYIEQPYRGEAFLLPFSGKSAKIPSNLLLLGTMNPYDRSVAQIDAAFVRRFDHIQLNPSPDVVAELLEQLSDFSAEQIQDVVDWFESVQRLLEVGLGHSFFKDVGSIDQFKTVWKYRIKPAAEVLLEFSPANRTDFMRSYDALIARLEGHDSGN